MICEMPTSSDALVSRLEFNTMCKQVVDIQQSQHYVEGKHNALIGMVLRLSERVESVEIQMSSLSALRTSLQPPTTFLQ